MRQEGCMWSLAAAASAVLLLASVVQAGVIYVDDGASGAGDGSSWEDAFTDLQEALAAAENGDEIRVGRGVYRPAPAGGSRDSSFVIDKAIDIHGGFAGVGAEDPDEQDPAEYKTILSGDLNGNDAVVGYAGLLLDEPTRQENSYNVVRCEWPGPIYHHAVLEGFVITGGNANSQDSSHRVGAGILGGDDMLTTRRCVIEWNSAADAGGGLWLAGPLEDCWVRRNYAAGYGGGVAMPQGALRCVIEHNVAGVTGGAIACPAYATAYVDCVIQYNDAPNGAGVSIGNQRCALVRCTIAGNRASRNGGGVNLSSDPWDHSELLMYRCRVIDNQAEELGGGVCVAGTSMLGMWSCLIMGNDALRGGGVFSTMGEYMGRKGRTELVNCTVYGNSASGPGGGIGYCSDSTEFLSVVNTIMWANVAAAAPDGSEDAQIHISLECPDAGSGTAPTPAVTGGNPIRFCCVQGWTASLGGEGNSGADPLFIDPDGLDDRVLTGDENLRLRDDSPYINSGTDKVYPCRLVGSGTGTGSGQPTGYEYWDLMPWGDESWDFYRFWEDGWRKCMAALVDLDNKPRIQGGRVDRGAYESDVPLVRVIYVDCDATGANNGTSWQDAFVDLQDAIAAAPAGHQIWIAQGTYMPADPNGDRATSFQLKNGVTVKGGFAGYGERLPDARDIKAYPTTLSGDLSGTLKPLTDGDFYDELMARGSRDYGNSLHVVAAIGVDASAVLDGVTITGGTANGRASDGSSEPASYQGGGIYVESASPTLIDCIITGNTAFGHGGHEAMGGGVYCVDSSPNLVRCSLIRNVAGDDSYGSAACGAGMAGEDSDLFLAECLFDHNWTDGRGGGIASYGTSRTNLRDCVFGDNVGRDGGGGLWAVGEAGGDVDGCVFSRNLCLWQGGAMCLGGGETWRISHCLAYGNQAEWAGAVYISAGDVEVVNCTIADNCAWDQWGGVMYDSGNVRFLQCIFWGNICDHDDVEWAQIGRGGRFDYCCVQGWTGQFPGRGTIDADPLFADAGQWVFRGWNGEYIVQHGDFHLKSQAGRWDPLAKAWVKDDVTSPCIDTGDPARAIMSEPFPNGGIINMGAYGGTAEASKSYFGGPACETMLAGDINGDCAVNLADFGLMAIHWLETY